MRNNAGNIMTDSTSSAAEEIAPLITLNRVTLSRGSFSLGEINLSCGPGEVILLVGHNGAGKTTFLRMLAGLLDPQRGCIKRHHRGISLVSHEPMSYGGLTVEENLSFFCALESRPIPDDLIRLWGLLPYLSKKTSLLSRGLTVRLSLVRALSSSAELLLFDEPTSNLDDSTARCYLEAITSLKAAGRTAIIATHDLNRLLPKASRMLVLGEGSILFDSHEAGGFDEALNRYHQSNR